MAKIDLKKTKLTRKIQPMPEWIKKELTANKVLDDFYARPDYQQNDYISWITRAKLEATQCKRLDQTIAELKKGGVYMGMKHNISNK